MDPNYVHTGEVLRNLLMAAWLLPLAGFLIEIVWGFWWSRLSKTPAYLAVACIGLGFVCSLSALVYWGEQTHWVALQGHGHEAGEHSAGADPHAAHAAEAAHPGHETHPAEHDEHALATAQAAPNATYSGTLYTLAHFGALRVSIDYYIDSLTLLMFTMVTLIATCIHVFAIGYMSDELTEDYVDHQVHTSHHGHLHRPGRFYRFFAFLSLFCFSMLGLVLAGNIFLVFIFWELVGVCSYFLIGFYTERKSASTAANKAFIMNRVGDFGFLIGLMIVWTWFGTFQFADGHVAGKPAPGLFSMVRGNDGQWLTQTSPTGQTDVVLRDGQNETLLDAAGSPRTIPYFLLVAAGLGIFGGCIGKSAQFPLQTWLPDAMEGPTPVSALVHSATMVAAGVYLTGRFYPMFTPEVLLTISYIGCITLFVGATIAVVATDIKRVLAYSTISQLGYMMLGLGVSGWSAGLFHLVTHAFFKSLMFLCSGSVIHGCHHVQEMPQMGGLRRKMPITAYTMLVGVIAICGLAIPGVIAFSGYHSKDSIVATALTFTKLNGHALLFAVPLIGAGITAFYMFRLWLYTFAGAPRDRHVYDHAHESPAVMWMPLVVLSIFAAFCAVGGQGGPLFSMLAFSEPTSVGTGIEHAGLLGYTLPGHAAVHLNHDQAGLYALTAAFLGAFVAYIFYGARLVSPAAVQQQFRGLHRFLVNKWGFDDLYETVFVKPAHVVAGWCAAFDRIVLDGFLHGSAKAAIDVSRWDRRFDETIVDGLVNVVGRATYQVGRSLRAVQTGQLRSYVMFIAVGVLGIFVLLIVFFPA
jgi:NADH-quinone oxidoreductase subunit L